MTPSNVSKKKILYVITKSNFGGAQRYVFDLATNLPKERFDLTVAMGGGGLLKQRLNEAGIRTLQVKHFGRDVSIVHDVLTFFELITLFRKEQPDVVHLNSGKATTIGALAARIARVPRIISTIHGWSSNEPRPFWQLLLIKMAERIGLFLAHKTIVVCAYDSTRGATTIYNGIGDIDFLSRDEARTKLGIVTDSFVIGSVGELTKNKNYAALITALSLLKGENGRPCAFHSIGDGEEREHLVHLARAKGVPETVFHGFLEDALGGRYLKAFDIFVLPSLKEGLPYVLLEAGNAGLAVVATNVGGVSEIIKDGHTGTLVKAGSASALKTAIERYMADPNLRLKHGTALKNHVRTSFVLSRMVDQTIALY